MAKKDQLRVLRTGSVINTRSKKQETLMNRALQKVVERLHRKFEGLKIHHAAEWKLHDVVTKLRGDFPTIDFFCYFESSSMRPDGGILSIADRSNNLRPILISEKKNQGTNDLRTRSGMAKQAKGNAIERLGKNVIGFRAAMKGESIFPFVCFGDGCDFADDSSILDRVVTIAQFGHLNVENLHKQGPRGEFDRGTFYFRENEWTEDEMADLSYRLAEKSVFYYFSKYGEALFR